VDSDGNVLVTSATAGKVFKIAKSDGTVTLFAGSGAAARSGDGGLRQLAGFLNLGNIHVSSNGTTLVGDDRTIRAIPDQDMTYFGLRVDTNNIYTIVNE
jgi:hypothetical protein